METVPWPMSPGKEASRKKTTAGRDFGMSGCWERNLGSGMPRFKRFSVSQMSCSCPSPLLSSPHQWARVHSLVIWGETPPLQPHPCLFCWCLSSPGAQGTKHLWYCSPDHRSRQKSLLRCWYIKGSIRAVSKHSKIVSSSFQGLVRQHSTFLPRKSILWKCCLGRCVVFQTLSVAITFSGFSVSSQKKTCHCQATSSSRRKILTWFWMQSHPFWLTLVCLIPPELFLVNCPFERCQECTDALLVL